MQTTYYSMSLNNKNKKMTFFNTEIEEKKKH